MHMNGSSTINWGRARRTGRPIMNSTVTSAPTELDVGNINIDDLLAETATGQIERQWTESLQQEKAKQALNAIQQWMLAHDSSTEETNRKMWRRANNVMTRLAANSRKLPDQMEVDYVQFNTAQPVDRGAFAEVFKGEYRGLSVAVKRLHLGDSHDRSNDELHRRFYREALIWFQLRHPNILELTGIYQQLANVSKYPCMISPWADGGSITQYITKPESPYDPRKDRISLLTEVAGGLHYVHQRGVFHGDFHDKNILIHNGHALLTDFGMTVVGDKSHSAIPTTQLPANATRWLAPELLVDDESFIPRKTSQGDMFGFGRLCLAICTKGVIYPGVNDQSVIYYLLQGKEPTRPQEQECDGLEMSDTLWDLATDCWQINASSRPSAADALQRLGTPTH